MKPIRAVISNFQSIKYLEFEIKGFTCITGPTNIGKSAIMRAIKSAILNSPVTNMIRAGEKSCTVELHSEEWGFTWQKGSTNRYYIDGKDEPLDSVGRGQIEEIEAFGFGSIKVGDSKRLHPWFASQFKPIFLIDQSGPAITDFISDVSRLDVLQRAINIANKGKRKAKDKIKLLEEDIKAQKEKRSRFSRHNELKDVLADLKAQKASINDYERKIARGEFLHAGIVKCKNYVDLFIGIEKVKIPDLMGTEEIKRLITAKKFNDQLQEKAKSIITIRNIEQVSIPETVSIPEVEKMAKIYSFQKKKAEYEAAIAKFSHSINIPEVPDSIEKLEKGDKLLAQMNKCYKEISVLEAKSRELEAKLKEFSAEIAKIPRCSTCEQPWDSSHAHSA